MLLHDYHFYLVGATGPRALPRRAAVPLRAHPLAGPGRLAGPAARHARGGPARAAGLRRRRLPHRSRRPRLPAVRAGAARPAGRPVGHDRRPRRPPGARRAATRSASTSRRSRRWPSSDASDEHLADLDDAAAGGPAGAARRPHRPEQEHRPRLHRLRADARRAPRAAGDACVFLALLQPSRQDVPEYAALPHRHRRGGRRRQRPASAPATGSRSTCGWPPTCRSRRPPTAAATSWSSTPSPTG